MSVVMGAEEVREFLPNRYPFLMVDRVVALEPGKSIEAIKNVTINEPFFVGHFPSYSVMPGVLIIEAMVQTAAILGFKTVGQAPKDEFLYYFAGTDRLRFKNPVVPGDQLQLKAELHSKKRHVWKFACSASVDGALVSDVLITCVYKRLD